VPDLFRAGKPQVGQIDAVWRGESWSSSKRNDADLTRHILYYGNHRDVVRRGRPIRVILSVQFANR